MPLGSNVSGSLDVGKCAEEAPWKNSDILKRETNQGLIDVSEMRRILNLPLNKAYNLHKELHVENDKLLNELRRKGILASQRATRMFVSTLNFYPKPSMGPTTSDLLIVSVLRNARLNSSISSRVGIGPVH